MPSLELVLGLMLAVSVLALVARWARVPYPIVLVFGGLVLALIPGLPPVTLSPDVVLLIFLPPLITYAGWNTSLRDLKANVRSISFLSVGLVLFSTVVVAAAAQALIPNLGWGPALVLGAVLAPTDAIAATATMERVGAPHRVVAIIEAESLLNDASGLVVYRYAVAAVVTGAFAIWMAGLQFVLAIAGGIALGLAIGWLLVQAWRRIDEPLLAITLSLLAPYGGFLLADRVLHVSGVLAVAAGAIYSGRRSSEVMGAAARMQGEAVWNLLVFVLNGLAFILIGLQLRQVVASLGGQSPANLVLWGLAISLTVIVARFVWVFPSAYLPRFLSRRLRERDPYPGWRNVVIVGWSGMRGVVSLAAALAIPLLVADGGPFPHRDLIIFLTFCAILVTLVVQGLSLPLLLRGLGVTADNREVREEAKARYRALDAALGRLDELAASDEQADMAFSYVRAYYSKRRHTLSTRFGRLDHEHSDDPTADGPTHTHPEGTDHLEEHRQRSESLRRLRQQLLDVERQTVISLRNQGAIDDSALRRVERDLDLEEIQLLSV